MTDGGLARWPHWRPHEKKLIRSLVKLSVVAWVMPFIGTPLHEFGHYWAAESLGIDTYIDGYRVVPTNSEQLTSSAWGLVYPAGGLTAGSFLVFLFMVMAKPYRYGTLPLIAAEFAYAPFDATMAGYTLHLVVFSATYLLIASVYLIRFLRAVEPRPSRNEQSPEPRYVENETPREPFRRSFDKVIQPICLESQRVNAKSHGRAALTENP